MPVALPDPQPHFIQLPEQQVFDGIRFPLVLANHGSDQAPVLVTLEDTINWLQDRGHCWSKPCAVLGRCCCGVSP